MAVVSRLSFVAAALLTVGVWAESHLFKFQNNCGHGTPKLIIGGDVLSNGEDYTHNGIFSGIAYLQTGDCGFNGDKCSLMEMTLVNGGVSSADISLIAPHQFNVPMKWEYINGGECDGTGKACLTANCGPNAFFQPEDYVAQVQCMTADSGLLITFCPGGGASPPSPTSSIKTTTTAAHTTTTAVQQTTTTAVQHTTSTSTPTTSSVVHITTSKSVVTPPSSTITSAVNNSSSSVASTSVASVSVAPSSVATTTLSVASATASSPVNRKQCKPGQKPRRKRDAAKREADTKRVTDAIKRDALAHHRRAHGHH